MLMKITTLRKIIAVVGMTIAISGCSTGPSVSQAQMAALIDKQSTKEDVINLLGHPDSRSVAAGRNEEWTYGYTFFGIPFTDLPSKSKATVFEFDRSGVLMKHYVQWR